jgi:hypothetical protein
MTEFLAQMPTDTMIFITTVFLGLAATLIMRFHSGGGIVSNI